MDDDDNSGGGCGCRINPINFDWVLLYESNPKREASKVLGMQGNCVHG